MIKNKIKRDEVVRKSKKAKGQLKLQRRLALAKLEANDPAAKKVRYNILFLFFPILLAKLTNLTRNVLQKMSLAPLTIPENSTHLS